MSCLPKSLCVLALLCGSALLAQAAPVDQEHQLLNKPQLVKMKPFASISCDACKVIVRILQDLFAQDPSEDEVAKISIRICIDFKIEDENVCNLVVPTFRVSSVR